MIPFRGTFTVCFLIYKNDYSDCAKFTQQKRYKLKSDRSLRQHRYSNCEWHGEG